MVQPDDLILIPGDISWASTASRVREDLRWLAERPGLKVVGRGNHDKGGIGGRRIRQTG